METSRAAECGAYLNSVMNPGRPHSIRRLSGVYSGYSMPRILPISSCVLPSRIRARHAVPQYDYVVPVFLKTRTVGALPWPGITVSKSNSSTIARTVLVHSTMLAATVVID